MDKRLKERPHECDYEALTYEHGTHFVLPETMLRKALPVGLKFVMKFIFKAERTILRSASRQERISTDDFLRL
jgi:hypothetical protein